MSEGLEAEGCLIHLGSFTKFTGGGGDWWGDLCLGRVWVHEA